MSTQPTIEELASAAAREIILNPSVAADPNEWQRHYTSIILRHLQPLAKDRERLQLLKDRSKYTGPSWGYHKGYHEIQFSSPSNWAPGKPDTAPDTPKDFYEALDVLLSTPKPASSS